MTNRYDTYNQRSNGDSGNRQQRYAQSSERQSRQSGGGRLSYEAQNRNHGEYVSARNSQRAADYSRDRYAQRSVGAQQRNTTHRHAELQQSGKIPRYVPEQDQRSRHEVAQLRNQMPDQRVVSAASRYARTGGNMYHARPGGVETAANKAGALTSPSSFIVRIAIVAVLVIVFGVRFAANSATQAQITSAQEQTATQQASLDDLNAQNEQLQANIDSRQATLDAYKAKQQSSS